MQKVILDLLPGGVAPIVYASQYDDGRSIRFMLTEGGPDSQYSLNASEVITCNLTKPDGTETVINVANPGAGKTYVDLVNGADDYDQAGAYLGEIVLTKDARVIGSANFVLKVEEDAYGGQITTLTATGNPCTFTTDLADALVSLTADIVCGGGGGTPSTPIPLVGHSELNLTRCGKNLFDKTATDVSNGYVANSWINENNGVVPDADCNISEYIPIVANTVFYIKGTAYGNPSICFYDDSKTFISGEKYNSRTEFSFTTPSNAAYMRFSIIKTNIDTTQIELGSTPSEYEPYNGQTFTVAFGQTVYGGVYDKSGRLTITHGIVDLGTLDYAYYGGRFNTTGPIADLGGELSGDYYVNVKCDSYIKSAGGENDTFFVYSNKYVYLYNSDYTDAAAFKTSLSGVMLAYELATPIVIDVPSISVFAENGTNNITSDGGGDVNVTYIKKV